MGAAERRASIVDAAMEVFAEVGYQRATMAEVARRVGVSEPVIFQNFGSKAAVFAAALQEATGRMTAALKEQAAASGSVAAWLTEFLGPGPLTRSHARDTHHVLFADAMSHSGDPVVRDAIRRAHRTVARTLAGLLARGQVEGGVWPDLDPPTGAWWLLSFLASRGFREATMPNGAELERRLGAMTLHALTGRPLPR